MEAGAQEPAGHESPAAMHESEGHETGRYHLRNRRRRRPANGEDGASPRSSSEGEG